MNIQKLGSYSGVSLIGITFLVAGLTKLFAFEKTYIWAIDMPFIPSSLALPFVQGLVLFELAIAVLIATPTTQRAGMAASVFALTLFMFFNFMRPIWGVSEVCPCFPKLLQMSSGAAIVFDALLLAIAALTYRAMKSQHPAVPRMLGVFEPDVQKLLAVSCFLCSLIVLIGSINARGNAETVFLAKIGGKALSPSISKRITGGDLPPGKYRISEFGDYSCMFCSLLQARLDRFIDKHEDVTYEFRDLPLVGVHAQALNQARFARFLLFDDPHSDGLLRPLMIPSGVGEGIVCDLPGQLRRYAVKKTGKLNAAYLSVQSDIALAKSLQIDGTPTFVITLKSGKSYLVGDSGALFAFLQWKFGE